MIKRLVKHGNSKALILDKTLIELLKVEEDGDLEIVMNGCSMTVTPVSEERRRLFEAAQADVAERHKQAFAKLATM